jgi:plastocyanin
MRTTVTPLRSIAIAATLALALTACSGAQQTESADTAVDDDATSTETVEARNISFEPADIEVAVGTTVTWVNADVVNHTVTSGPAGDPDGMFDESLASGGDDATVTFGEAGTFDYHCDLHRTMVGTVTVTG